MNIFNRPGVAGIVLQTSLLREAIPGKNLLPFDFFQNCLDPPPPPCFLESFEELFQNLILYELKFLKVFGLWLSPANLT